MYDKYEMWVEEYVIFSLQLPPTGGISPAPVEVVFNSWEIFQVDQNDGTDIELWTSEIGTSNGVVKVNGLSFAFAVDANFTPETRKKVMQMFHYLSKGCEVSFTFNNYKSYVPTFPHNNPSYTPSDLHNPAVVLPYSCVSLLSKPIDSTHDGMGVLFGENSTVSFIVKETVSPLDLAPCKRLSINDFALSPWVLDFDGTGWYVNIVYVEASLVGLIDKFLSHPDGTLDTVPPTTASPFLWSAINPTNTVMEYSDSFLNYLTDGETYQVIIPNIKVLLKTGETCELTFTQQFTVHL